MVELTEIGLSARIRRLEHRRSDLWSVAGGAGLAARVCREVLNGQRPPSREMLARCCWSRVDVIAAYRERLAERLTVNLLARAQAKAITLEIRKLRGLAIRPHRATTEEDFQ
ncbi:hypothetical protein M0D69_04715 [Caballeronia sp. SEWSISQ10-4 2]|uniref:hypothetical protein n=1 Tax=Caballeronia sp. SEWSISQ10-4 2 TaxID=2937438 RepID=UPI00264CCBB6|nr:hypothetical protein [Caballeronia sp. SEWSISQ10-4 2]MDN7177326.1 hypothetical protein [Caballeronia sp. SEWSISQ10-4 2]